METSPRLMIERVELENFKSYAGFHLIGPFHKNFTAVVGPNGSGKSNLLECLLFAFGKRATKMRLKKLSELIHHSKAHSNLNFAKVTVHFQNIVDHGPDQYEVVPGSQFRLSRTVFKSSQSKYEIDGQDSSYEDVTSTLKQRGIDLEHNRFLILQGEVEQIALMKPKGTQDDEGKQMTSGLLDYLEEIIGTNGYIKQIQDGEKLIEDAHEGLALKQNNLNQSREAVQALDGPKEEALASLRLEQETFQLRNLQSHLSRYKHNKTALELEAREQRLQTEKTELEERFSKKKEEHKEVIQEFGKREMAMRRIEQQEIDFKKTYEQLELQHTECTTAKEMSEKKVAKVKGEIDKQEAKVRSLLATMEEANHDLPRKVELLERATKELDETSAQYQALELQVLQKTENLQQQRSKLTEDMRPVQAQQAQSKLKLEGVQAQINRLIQEQEETARTKTELEQQRQTTEERLQALKNELDFLQNTLRETEARREESKTAMQQAKLVYEDLTTRTQQLQQRKQQSDHTAKKAEFVNKMDYEIRAAVRTGRLQGVRGRLGDLGLIPAAFDVAVSSAINRLDNYVVESVEHGDALIAFVRERQLGRVTAMVLEKLQDAADQCRRPFQSPAGSTRLFDNIECDQQDLAPAFYSAFQDTLVTKTIEEARAIAYGERKRHRVVTVTGEIINPAGDMQGFAQPKKGKMKLVGHQNNDVEMQEGDLTAELENLEREKLTAATEMKKRQEEYTKLMREMEELKVKMKAVVDDLQQWKARADAVKRDLRTVLDVPERTSELERLQTPLKQHEAIVAKISKTLELMEAQVQRVMQDIEIAGGPEYQRLKQARKEQEELLRNTDEEVQMLKTKAMQAYKDVEKANVHMEELKGKLQAAQAEVNSLTEKLTELENQAEAIATNIGQVSESKQLLKKEIDTMRKQQSELKIEFDRMTEQRNAVKNQLKELKTERKKNDDDIELWNIRIQANREKYRELETEYQDLLLPVEEHKGELEPKRRHKDNYAEEKKDLLFPIDKEFRVEELEGLQLKEEIVNRITTFYEDMVAKSRPDLHVIKEYRERVHQMNEYQAQLDTTRAEVETLRLTCAEIKRKRFDQFSEGFLIISKKLREMYQMLTRGGDAELEYADSTDPFAEGIVFTVRPPKKSWKKMANLSGGEKTLSSLALVFALHHYKPTALYVMDEVDAALDFQNVSIIANYIKSRTRDAQFIIVSLRYQNFELADQLVGVYKTHDASKTLSITPGTLKETSNPIVRQTVENIRCTQVVSAQE